MWRIISILFVILLLFFGYAAFKDSKYMPKSTEQAKEAAGEFSLDFVESFQELMGDTIVLPEDMSGGAPIVNEEDLGELSSLYGKIKIAQEPWGPEGERPDEEYVVLRAESANSGAINITGWSLQSMISGVRIYIPDAVEDLMMHSINPTYEVELLPGQEAVVASAESPVGVSFKTNMCTGYLGHFQRFEPELEKNCPSPGTVFPPTIQNLQLYGGECVEFASTLPACAYATEEMVIDSGFNIRRSCLEHLQTLLTYTTCSAQNREREDYAEDARFRIFLNSPSELWRNEYEVIRLLDEVGRTVDVYSY